MSDCQTFPNTVEEFMEEYKIVDSKQIYTNGTAMVPIFRMKQWFEHLPSAQSERKKGRWIDMDDHVVCSCCGATHYGADKNFCPNCGVDMRGEEQ